MSKIKDKIGFICEHISYNNDPRTLKPKPRTFTLTKNYMLFKGDNLTIEKSNIPGFFDVYKFIEVKKNSTKRSKK